MSGRRNTAATSHRMKGWVWAAIIVAGLIWAYFAVFHDADVLEIRDGKAVGTKPTWLIGHFREGGGDERYYKLADVGAPKGYSENREATDPDEDPVTTFFAFSGKDPDKDPGSILIQPLAMPMETAAREAGASVGGADEACAGCWVLKENADEEKKMTLFLPSPYEAACIRLEVTMPVETEDADMAELAAAASGKIVPGKKMSAIAADFKLNFLDDNRWTYLTNGLLVTLEITLGAVLLGIVLGVIVATVRSTWEQNNENMHRGFGRGALSFANEVCGVYLTVIRGTPVVIQLMIMYYIIFASSRNGVAIAVLAFGINSGAYVAEIIRGGIMSIDRGQLEAGRSLGFNYVQTMRHIIIPQAMKNVLPALANEFIVLLKETSVSGYVAVRDLTKGGDIIRGVTYSAFMPLLAVAAIYLVMVMFFTYLVSRLERRLRASDH